MILSHHGELEFGSPKLPLFPEALILHYLDDMDSKMESMRVLVDQDKQVEGHFTNYSSSLERAVLKKAKYMAQAGVDCGGHAPAALPAAQPAVRPEPAPASGATAPPSAKPQPAPGAFARAQSLREKLSQGARSPFRH